MVPRRTQGGWATAQVQPPDQSHGEPQTTPRNKVGTGAPGGGVPAPGPDRRPDLRVGWPGSQPARDAEAPATPPPHPGTSPAARPARPPPPSGGRAAARPSADFLPGRAAEGGGGGTAGTGAGLQVAGPGRRARGGGGGAGHVARPGRAEPRGLPLSRLHLLRGERVRGRRRSVLFRGGPRGLRDAFSPLREPRARAGAPGAGRWKSLPAATSAAGRQAPAGSGREGGRVVTLPVDQRHLPGPVVCASKPAASARPNRVIKFPLLPVFAFLFGKHSFRGPHSRFGC